MMILIYETDERRQIDDKLVWPVQKWQIYNHFWCLWFVTDFLMGEFTFLWLVIQNVPKKFSFERQKISQIVQSSVFQKKCEKSLFASFFFGFNWSNTHLNQKSSTLQQFFKNMKNTNFKVWTQKMNKILC